MGSGDGAGGAGTGMGGAPPTAIGGSNGAAGATGTGGSTGAGGAPSTGTGGSSGNAGATGSGGKTGAGGATGGGSGGKAGTGGATGAGGATGTGGKTGTGGLTGNGTAFSQCRFHFGTIDAIARANPSMIPQLDFFTPGWMGSSDTFNMGSVCAEGNPGGVLANQVPVIVAYVAAFYAKRHFGRCDCNVTSCGAGNDYGAADIQDNLSAIIGI
jgi:hypothetical protein